RRGGPRHPGPRREREPAPGHVRARLPGRDPVPAAPGRAKLTIGDAFPFRKRRGRPGLPICRPHRPLISVAPGLRRRTRRFEGRRLNGERFRARGEHEMTSPLDPVEITALMGMPLRGSASLAELVVDASLRPAELQKGLNLLQRRNLVVSEETPQRYRLTALGRSALRSLDSSRSDSLTGPAL